MQSPIKTAALAAVLTSSAAFAALTPYTSQSSFDAAFPSATVEVYDVVPPIIVTEGNPATLRGITYSVTGEDTIAPLTIADDLNSGVGSTSFDSVIFTFDSPINAFGGDFVNAFSAQGLRFTTDQGDTINAGNTAGFPPPGTGFFGFGVDDAFSVLTITSAGVVNQLEVLDVDNVRFNTLAPIPEPASLGLLSVAGLGLLRRRKA